MNGDLEVSNDKAVEDAEKMKETANEYFKSRFI